MKFLCALIFLSNCLSANAELTPTLLIDQKNDLSMQAKAQSHWKLFYTDNKSGQKHNMFMPMHDKIMHMIVISKDLSHLAHIHPYFSKKMGEFNLVMNKAYGDFDNQDTLKALQFSSDYFVFTEVMPMYRDGRESQMEIDRFLVNVTESEEGPKERSYILDDSADARSGITKYFTKYGDLAEEGEAIKVVFHYEQFEFCDRYLPKFYFHISRKNTLGEYVAVPKFERWLGMGAHSILISAEGRALKDRIFYHLHAFLPLSTAGQFVFPYHDHVNHFRPGHYKIWSQMRIGNIVYKFPFDFKYTLPREAFLFNFSLCAN